VTLPSSRDVAVPVLEMTEVTLPSSRDVAVPVLEMTEVTLPSSRDVAVPETLATALPFSAERTPVEPGRPATLPVSRLLDRSEPPDEPDSRLLPDGVAALGSLVDVTGTNAATGFEVNVATAVAIVVSEPADEAVDGPADDGATAAFGEGEDAPATAAGSVVGAPDAGTAESTGDGVTAAIGEGEDDGVDEGAAEPAEEDPPDEDGSLSDESVERTVEAVEVTAVVTDCSVEDAEPSTDKSEVGVWPNPGEPKPEAEARLALSSRTRTNVNKAIAPTARRFGRR
jgi:hypothetical protein